MWRAWRSACFAGVGSVRRFGIGVVGTAVGLFVVGILVAGIVAGLSVGDTVVAGTAVELAAADTEAAVCYFAVATAVVGTVLVAAAAAAVQQMHSLAVGNSDSALEADTVLAAAAAAHTDWFVDSEMAQEKRWFAGESKSSETAQLFAVGNVIVVAQVP